MEQRNSQLEAENSRITELALDQADKAIKRIGELEAELASESAWAKTYSDRVAALEAELIEDKPGCWSTPEERRELLRRIEELEEMTRKLDAEKSSAELAKKTTIEQHKVTLQRIAELNRKAEVRIKILETRIVELEATLQYERNFYRRIA